MYFRRALPLLLPILLALPRPKSEPQTLQRFEFGQLEMGTLFRIVLYAKDAGQAQAASRAAFERIAELDRRLSDYRPDSELNRVCRQAVVSPQVVSPELFLLLQESVELSCLTGGAFDVAAKPLVQLWRRARQEKALPAPSEIEAARGRTGYQGILLNPLTRSVRLNRSGMELDLGAIAKGFAADEACRILRKHGVERALVDAGGDIRLGRPPPGEPGWNVQLDSSDGKQFFQLAEAAVATSGDDFQFVTIEGVRYSHILDPRTGWPLKDRRLVTVVAASAMEADAWATALSVLDPEQGLDLIAQKGGLSARIEVRNSGQVFLSKDWPLTRPAAFGTF